MRGTKQLAYDSGVQCVRLLVIYSRISRNGADFQCEIAKVMELHNLYSVIQADKVS